MDLSKIVAIGGKPGLYQMIGQGKNNVLVESLLDGKRFAAFAHEKLSVLEEISIYTTGEDRPLKEVFKNIRRNIGETLDFDFKKLSNNELAAKFELAVPDYSVESVYVSDMRKVFSWYQLLQQKGLLDFNENPSEGEAKVNPQEEAPSS
ncbi:MAG: DUF5606 domain-containing protein [Bacteroidales bacterium]|nr:DUF5606 domain-containing protein [Bacteroidales bacterium]